MPWWWQLSADCQLPGAAAYKARTSEGQSVLVINISASPSPLVCPCYLSAGLCFKHGFKFFQKSRNSLLPLLRNSLISRGADKWLDWTGASPPTSPSTLFCTCNQLGTWMDGWSCYSRMLAPPGKWPFSMIACLTIGGRRKEAGRHLLFHVPIMAV